MEDKINKIIKKLKKQNDKFQKALDKGLTKFKSSRARQSIQMNTEFIAELEKTLS
jgi:hypothetical protein